MAKPFDNKSGTVSVTEYASLLPETPKKGDEAIASENTPKKAPGSVGN